MQMVIPCGGLATRLGEIAKETPKSMVEINGKPFLEHQIELLKKYDFDDIILCVGHLRDKIFAYFGNGEKFGIKIRYSIDNQLGVIGAIKNAEQLLKKHFFIMYGDSYLPHLDFNDLYSKFLKQNRLAMMSVWHNKNKIEPSNIKVKSDRVISIGEKNSEYIDYGAIVLDKKTMDFLPENKKISTKEFWSFLIKKDELAVYHIQKRFYHIGTPQALQEVKKLLKNNH